ncbi:class I SAM-dependent methyltransferase [Flavobacterium sp. J372]|uniref:class I SAM-dependent methyltransferase n=1 Tax=Flavobacterium sp. J372 TaxID=2898436 RepID=UPI002151E556|nr:class I SAM-dependent methyltransferase [Flavobacterium sp. J372]MCR5862678.1 class I SAM-dependent methyltransferase [Flavobacterium sp. J372]
MFENLLAPEIQEFIRENSGQNPSSLALKKNPFPGNDWQAIISQIAAREKAKDKLPTWYDAENIIYPSKISVEQTSSETTAQFKAKLVSGENLIDLTGGFGVDDQYFAKVVNHVTHCELNPELSAIAAHNFKILGADNITCITGDSFETLKNSGQKWDWIYIDPSRRSDAKGKVFMLKDCLPNVPELLDIYLTYSNNILIKTAPILDISAGFSELSYVKSVYIVALNNEVKELLWHIERGFNDEPALHSINLEKGRTDSFTAPLQSDAVVHYANPLKYLYEPNAAIMKSGAFAEVAEQFDVKKLHPHSHLYTSDMIIDFPGRRFEVQQVIPYSKKEMKEFIQAKKMNVTVRNFPQTVEDIRKKWKISDGGETYTFFTTRMNNEKIVVLCAKI